MIGILLGAAAALLAIAYCVVGASYTYCRLSGHMDLFVFPYDQWFDALAYWGVNRWTKIDLVVSAALPLLLAFGIGRIVYIRRRAAATSLFGKTGWAAPTDMKSGGIERTRKL